MEPIIPDRGGIFEPFFAEVEAVSQNAPSFSAGGARFDSPDVYGPVVRHRQTGAR